VAVVGGEPAGFAVVVGVVVVDAPGDGAIPSGVVVATTLLSDDPLEQAAASTTVAATAAANTVRWRLIGPGW
jgi:hypothetical protein